MQWTAAMRFHMTAMLFLTALASSSVQCQDPTDESGVAKNPFLLKEEDGVRASDVNQPGGPRGRVLRAYLACVERRDVPRWVFRESYCATLDTTVERAVCYEHLFDIGDDWQKYCTARFAK